MNTDSAQSKMESTQMPSISTPVKKGNSNSFETPPQVDNKDPLKTPNGIQANTAFFSPYAPLRDGTHKRQHKRQRVQTFPIMDGLN